jgi:hypothetical protein
MRTIVSALTEFLLEYTPQRFCGDCIAFGLELGRSEAVTALAGLARGIAITTETGLCSACLRRVPVYGVDRTDPAHWLVTSRAVATLPDGACQSCLAEWLQLPMPDVLKALWRLPAAGEVVITTGRCSVCGTLGMLVQPHRPKIAPRPGAELPTAS